MLATLSLTLCFQHSPYNWLKFIGNCITFHLIILSSFRNETHQNWWFPTNFCQSHRKYFKKSVKESVATILFLCFVFLALGCRIMGLQTYVSCFISIFSTCQLLVFQIAFYITQLFIVCHHVISLLLFPISILKWFFCFYFLNLIK